MHDDDTTELRAGQRLGTYEIVRPLGHGAFGAVYEALRLPLKKRVALKVLRRAYIDQADVVERFVREAEIIARIDHPHIVGVFDVGVEAGTPFLAMEFLDGESLAALLAREERLAVAPGVDVFLALASALAAVHERGVVHRDIKPDNIFLARTATGAVEPKLLDFGVAKVHGADKVLTRSNAVVGTPHYMSPEQAFESKHVDAASDQWSLAVVLHESLTGARLFDGTSLLAVLNAITTAAIPSPRAVLPAIPEGLAAVILRALDRDASKRFDSMRAFGAALLPFASARARERWEAFFRLDGAPRGHDDDRGTTPGIGTALTLTPTPAPMSVSPGAPTLEPTSQQIPLRTAGVRPRRPALTAVAAGVVLLGLSGWAVLRARGNRSHVLATGAPAPAAPVSSAGSPPLRDASGAAPAALSARTADAAVPPVAVDPAGESAGTVPGQALPTQPPQPPQPREAVAHTPPNPRGPHGPRVRPRNPADCPNGICPVD